MSKGNNFRPPRKRGFDDDDTSGGFDRPRGPRFGGAPGGEFGAPSPMGGAGGPVATGPSVNATVKWFKGEKGYGFVELADGAGDAFLHANALQASGHESVPAGAKLVVQVGQGAKGAQVTRVLEVDTANIVAPARPPRPGFGDRPDRGGFGGGGGGGGFGGGDARPRRAAPDPATAVPLAGKVKWFDETKGFGFVASEDGGKDVFVHISVLGAAGITRLTEGQPVMMKVVNTPKGREAISLSTSA